MYAVKLICLTISFEKATPKLDSKTVLNCIVNDNDMFSVT